MIVKKDLVPIPGHAKTNKITFYSISFLNFCKKFKYSHGKSKFNHHSQTGAAVELKPLQILLLLSLH